MRTISTKKELVQAINDGERHVYVADKKLYDTCKVVSHIQSHESLLSKLLKSRCEYLVIEGGNVVAITVVVCVTALSILAICKNKNVKIKVKDKAGNEGELEIG